MSCIVCMCVAMDDDDVCACTGVQQQYITGTRLASSREAIMRHFMGIVEYDVKFWKKWSL